jgi:lipopolysaccharide/colanic/teichoic acid biosynthesis glycosyltransferase
MTLMFLAVLAIVWSAAVCRRRLTERTLIVGTSPLARKICGELSGSFSPHRVVGVIDDLEGTPDEDQFGARLAGPLARLGPLIEELRPDRIVVALVDRRGRLPLGELIDARVRGIAVEDGVAFYERLTGKIAIEALAPSHLFSSPDFRKGHFDLAFGHALSLLVAVTALVALMPLFALLAAAIKLESRGPVFFVHERVGICGRRLRLLKFRTMHPAAAPTSEWVRDNGHRITRLGKWLRRCRLDELPQLINVVRGEMNLIGPRPHPASNFELFMRSIPYYSLRAAVRPGLTGWAQVRQGYANSLEEETEKMRYDLYYIKHMSVWLDLRILFETVLTVTTGRGSSAVTHGCRRTTRFSPAIRLEALRSLTPWLSAFAGAVQPQPIRARVAATPLAIPAGGGETLEVGK